VARQAEVVRFQRSHPDVVLAVLRDLSEHRNGWVNIQAVPPDADDDEPDAAPARPGLFGLFSGRGPAVPVSTWVPGATSPKGTEPDSLGIQHGAGPKAARRLVEAGVTAPDDWTVLSDHPRRGLVVQLPPGTPPGALLDWLLRASDVLAVAPLPDTWVAVVHRR
jgi:hypothetical protein